MRSRLTPKNILIYVIGIAVTSFGVVLAFRSGYGGSAGDTLVALVADLLGTTLGIASTLVCTLYILFLSLYFRTGKFAFLFFQVFLFAPFVDLWDLVVLAAFRPEAALRWVTLGMAALVIPLGCTLLIRSTLPAGIYDELMFFTAHVTKLRLAPARTLNEILIVGAAVGLGFLTGRGFFTVGIGTLVYALTVGPLIRGWTALFECIFPRRETP